MPPARRLSAVPLLSTTDEQREFLRRAEEDPKLLRELALVTGKAFGELNIQERLAALRTYQKGAMVANVTARSARAYRLLSEEAALIEEAETDTRIVMLEVKLDAKAAELETAQAQLRQAEKTIKKMKKQLVKASSTGQGDQ